MVDKVSILSIDASGQLIDSGWHESLEEGRFCHDTPGAGSQYELSYKGQVIWDSNKAL